MRLRWFAAVATLVLTSFAARADDFNFSFAGQLSGSGQFTAGSTGTAGEFLVTGITGTVGGATIASLLAPGTYPSFNPPPNDNLLYLPASGSPTYVDYEGISFTATNGVYFNLVYEPGFGYGFLSSTDADGTNATNALLSSFSVTQAAATPEPSSIALLGTGLLCAAWMFRRRFMGEEIA